MTTCTRCGAFISDEVSAVPMVCGYCGFGSACVSAMPMPTIDGFTPTISAEAITPRDLFAAAALCGWVASLEAVEMDEYTGEDEAFAEHQAAVAKTCWGYADAMLKAREGA